MIIFFDIDDTLVDHTGAMRAAAATLHTRVNSPLLCADFLERWLAAHARHYPRFLKGELGYADACRTRIREVIAASLSDDEADVLFARYIAEYELACSSFPDVRPCLDRLASLRLGIISNGPGAQQRNKLARARIADSFDVVVTSEDCGFAKPDPRIFRFACEVAGEPAADAVHVGDHPRLDADAARSAGLRGIWLDRHTDNAGRDPAQVIRSLSELPMILG
jgi:putative hydrolase of the HAD superfamily